MPKRAPASAIAKASVARMNEVPPGDSPAPAPDSVQGKETKVPCPACERCRLCDGTHLVSATVAACWAHERRKA